MEIIKEEIERISTYFTGKIVTILSTPINRQFDEKQSMDYFVGRFDHISEMGIWATHPTTGCKNFYLLHHIIGIIEEQFVKKDDPNYEEVMNEYEKKIKEKPQQQQSPYVDVNYLNQYAQEARG